MFHDQRQHGLALVPFRLQEEDAAGPHLGGLLFGPKQVMLVEHDHLQFIGALEGFRQCGLELLRAEAYMVPFATEGMRAAGLDVRAEARFAKRLRQCTEIVHERLPSGDHGDARWESARFGYNGFNLHQRMGARIPALLHIAPGAAHVAAPEADEARRLACEAPFTLNGVRRLHDGEQGGHGVKELVWRNESPGRGGNVRMEECGNVGMEEWGNGGMEECGLAPSPQALSYSFGFWRSRRRVTRSAI